jgi:hypothetical protein
LRVATKIGSTFFGFSQVTGQLKSCKMIIYHQHEISDRKNTIMPSIWILGLWTDFGRRPSGHVSKLRFSDFSSSPWNFWSKEHNHAQYWKFGTLAGLGSRPQAQMTMGPIQKTFLVLRLFKGALTCSILIAGTQVMLRKAYPGLLGHGSKIPDHTIKTHTPMDLCSKFQLSRCYTGREISHRQTDGQTDGRTDDITISVEPIFFLNVL